MGALLTLTLALLSGSLFAQDGIIGVWDTGEGNVEVYKTGDKFLGNPIVSSGVRRTELEILNLEYENERWKGKLYAIKNDKLVYVECRIKDEELHLRVKAGIMKRTIKWIRIQ